MSYYCELRFFAVIFCIEQAIEFIKQKSEAFWCFENAVSLLISKSGSYKLVDRMHSF